MSLVGEREVQLSGRAVFPIGKNEEWCRKYPAQARAFEEGVNRYMRMHLRGGLAPRRRKCPDCGVQIGPRKRYCQVCAGRRKRESDSEYHRKARGRDHSSVALKPGENLEGCVQEP